MPRVMLMVMLLALCSAGVPAAAGQTTSAARPLAPVAGKDAVLVGWGIDAEQLPQAQQIGVRQIIDFSDDPGRLAALVREAGKHQIAILGCVMPIGADLPQQEMNAEENAFRQRVLADPAKEKGKYQFGGEPHDPQEVLDQSIACFDHEAVRQEMRKRIRNVVMVEGIAGVAFDFFGYCNYRCCRCPLSRELAAAYRREHPELSAAAAEEAFALESLVRFNNEMADYARSLKPGIRVACHVHPVFLPDLYYGNRLKIDECAQTAAWYFEPYWSAQRIEEHVRRIFGDDEARRYWPSARPAALIGVPTEFSVHVPKPVERVEFELRTLLAAGAARIHVVSLKNILKSPAYAEVFQRIFAAPPPG